MPQIIAVLTIAGWIVLCGNAAYLLLTIASVLTHRSRFGRSRANAQTVPATVLKPLCGPEPGLEAALESFLSQETLAPVRFVLGAASATDRALPIARAVAARYPHQRVEIRVDPRRYGTNPKVDNLINMSQSGLDEIVVVSDSDIVIPPGSLQRLLDQFSGPGVGAVTTLYRGRPANSRSLTQYLGALYLDGWFLPTAVLHARLASPQVCYGPMTAIRLEVLQGAGGFAALANTLADDTELGKLTRRQGYAIAFSPDVVETWVNDESLRGLFVHELRWARTIRALEPAGYLASIFMHPGPLPVLLALITGAPLAWAAALGVLMLRWVMVRTVWRRFGRARGFAKAGPLALWLREQIYFAVWIFGLFGRGVVWRGRALRIAPGAHLQPTEALGLAELELS